jgi:outer membrane lipoprotein SlyB
MKLYVINPNTNRKIYLTITASTRYKLAQQIGYYTFSIDNLNYHVNSVHAEIETNGTATGAAVGGLVGTIGGPVGIFIGGLLGGLVGNTSDEQKINAVRTFNLSQA